jgi:EpsD family peptidyl-prolyl cis-trans isomerase
MVPRLERVSGVARCQHIEGDAMKLYRRYLSVAVACLALGGCHFQLGGKTIDFSFQQLEFWKTFTQPSGQVVARVHGREITIRELNAELGNQTQPNPAAQRFAEQAALAGIIRRTILARAAEDEDANSDPEFILRKQRLTDELLVQWLGVHIAKGVPVPTRDDAKEFILRHPDTFSERKIFVVDQLRMAVPYDPNILKQMQPLHSLGDIEELLDRNNIKYQLGQNKIDALQQDPDLIAAILKVGEGDVFIFASSGVVVANQIRDVQVEPIEGEDAVNAALQLMKHRNIQEAVSRNVNAILLEAAGSVRYNPRFAPSPVPPASKTPNRPVNSQPED